MVARNDARIVQGIERLAPKGMGFDRLRRHDLDKPRRF
jgi:hypothetical protein